MKRLFYIICTFAMLSLALLSHAQVKDVVTNGGFEMEPVNPDRPPYWFVGFIDSPQEFAQRGSWALDASIQSEGLQSLRLEPNTDESYFLSQILHAPTFDLTGKSVTVHCNIRHQGLNQPPSVLVAALNESLTPDPLLGVGVAGKVLLTPDGPEGSFQTVTGQFTATHNATLIAAILSTSGTTGTAWFDDFVVEMDVATPGPDPDPVSSPIAQRDFKLGFVQENPIDHSEKATEDLIVKVASAAEVINLFAHVRWCALTDEDISYGHRPLLRQAELSRQAGLEIGLTFDFTHNTADDVGHINPTPDGTPVGSLNDPDVVRAYQDELYTLCDIILPEYVMVGIEVNIFYDFHPEQWPAYVAMFKQIADTLTARYPGIHVTAYFTLPWIVASDGTIHQEHAAVWQQLLPELQSVGFSIYPEVLSLAGVDLAPGFFVKAGEIAPGLPLLLPEFGVPGGPDAALDLENQAALLERIFSEFDGDDVELTVWYSMYDQDFLGAPDWVVESFSRMGMHLRDGTPKSAWALWQAVHAAGETGVTHPDEIRQALPVAYELFQNYPNPFNPKTTIAYTIPEDCRDLVDLSVYDCTGRLVQNLVHEHQRPGQYRIVFDGDHLTSGMYVYRISAGKVQQIIKMLLLQ